MFIKNFLLSLSLISNSTQSKILLGYPCQANDQCRRTPVDGTKVCFNHQCQCADGYVPIDSYRCLRDLEPSNSNQPRTNRVELKDPPGYGSSCTSNSDCQQLTIQLECLRGTCVCLEGYVPLGKYLCYNIHDHGHEKRTDFEVSSVSSPTKSLLGGICQTKDDCQTIDARCLNQICLCPERSFPIDDWNCLGESGKFHPSRSTSTAAALTTTNFNWWPWSSSSTSSPTRKSYFRCLLNQQCLHLDAHSHCQSGRCICNVGFRLDFTAREPRCLPYRTTETDENCD